MYTLYNTSHHKHHTITCKNIAFRIRKYRGKTHCTHPSTLKCSLSFWEHGNIYPLQTQLYPPFSFTHSNFTRKTLRKDSFSNINRDYNRICIKMRAMSWAGSIINPSFNFRNFLMRQRKQPSSTVHRKTKNSNE